MEPVVKVCKKCGETKQLSSFHKHRGCKYGYNTVCKECRKPISQREWSIKPYQQKILSRAKSRAAKKGLEFNLTIEDIIIPAICPVFKKPIVVPSIDRIDSSKGYVRGNIRIIENRANVLKNNATVMELQLVLEDLTI